jgi:hypothetical protein
MQLIENNGKALNERLPWDEISAYHRVILARP